MASMAGGTSTWLTSIEKLVSPALARLEHGHGVGRRRRLEADAEEDDLAVGLGLGDGHGVERRVHDADVAPVRPDREQVAAPAGDPEHVAERAEHDLGP